MSIIRNIFWFILLITSHYTYAGTDPVAWSLSPTSGFRQVNVGESTSVVYTLTANPNLPGPVVIHTQFKQTGGTFAFNDQCNNHTLSPSQDCQITITYTPTNNQISSIQLIYQYNHNVIPVPVLRAQGTGTSSNVTGSISGLPDSIYLNNHTPITFTVTYTNHGSDVTGYAGNSLGTDLLSVNPDSKATVSVVSGQNFCGTSGAPILLKSGHQCTLQGQLTAEEAGGITVSGLFSYDNATKFAHANATSTIYNGNSCITGEATLPLQSPTYQYADNVVQFTFTNHCDHSVGLGNVSYASSGTSTNPMITPTSGSSSTPYDLCSSQTLNATGNSGDSCTVLVSVIPQTTGSLSLTATVSPSGTATTSTTVNAPSYNHTIRFINQCPFPVWYGVAEPGDPTVNPSPNTYLLAAQAPNTPPVMKSITLPGIYRGQFFPRTGCGPLNGNFVCATGDCGSDSTGKCTSGANYEPYTRIEEAFTQSTQGGYDLSLINGVSIPVEFKGMGPFVAEGPLRASPHSPFICTGAGAIIQPPFAFNPQYGTPPPPYPDLPPPATPMGYCAWNYSAPAPSAHLYNFVTNTGSIADCSACTSGTCGLAFETTPADGNIVLSCGKLLGYWTINQFCTQNNTYTGINPLNNPYTAFNCNTAITDYSDKSYATGTTVGDLYSCGTIPPSTLGSCYNSDDYENDTCCGALDWNNTYTGHPYLNWQSSQSYISNSDWLNGGSGAHPRLSPTPLESIQWLKEGCPSSYTYPYDDHSSTFNCDYSDAAQTTAVSMDFEILFCPGGVIGDINPDP